MPELKRIKHVRHKNMDEMTTYEKFRVALAIIHVVVLLFSPIVVILVAKYLKELLRKREKLE